MLMCENRIIMIVFHVLSPHQREGKHTWVCVCVCVCVSERERDDGCMCVCGCAFASYFCRLITFVLRHFTVYVKHNSKRERIDGHTNNFQTSVMINLQNGNDLLQATFSINLALALMRGLCPNVTSS